MTHPAHLREKALSLRTERHLTIDEIADRLKLSRSTIYYWVREIPIPRTPRRLEGSDRGRRRGNRTMCANFKARRDAAYRGGWAEYGDLIEEPTFRDFVCLYLCEGYRRNRNRVSLGNSDPRIVWLADHWIRRLSRNRVTYSFQHHADQDPEYLRRFWAFGLNVDVELVRFQRKSNSGKLTGRTWRSKHGVLTVCANDTLLRARLQAWMDRVQEDWLDSVYGV